MLQSEIGWGARSGWETYSKRVRPGRHSPGRRPGTRDALSGPRSIEDAHSSQSASTAGFPLIDMMIVAGVIGFLATIAIPLPANVQACTRLATAER